MAPSAPTGSYRVGELVVEVTSEAPRDPVTALCKAVCSSHTFLEPVYLGASTENQEAGRMERGGIRTHVSAGGEDHSVGHAPRDGLPGGRASSDLLSPSLCSQHSLHLMLPCLSSSCQNSFKLVDCHQRQTLP